MADFIGQETPAEREERLKKEAAAQKAFADRNAARDADREAAVRNANKGTNKINDLDDKMQGKFESDQGQQTPLLTNVGKESWDLGAGTGKAVGGVVTGDWDTAKKGLKQAGSSVMSALTAGSLRSLNNPPAPSYAGGSQDALAANRAQYDAGILAGQDQNIRGEGLSMYGAGVANTAAQMGAGTYDASQGLYGAGMATAMTGMGGQTAALDASIAAANRNVGSIAEAQQRMANDTQARQMAGLAASARGGNQAAAMRNANTQASQNALVNNQQIGMMRLKEEQDLRAAQTQAQQFAASQYGDRANLGYGTAASGLGAANTATSQVNTAGSTIGGVGTSVMGSGSDSTKTFVGAETEQNKSQLDADQKNASAKQASKGGVMGVVGKAIGGLFG